MTTIGVFGASGFIGSTFVERLLAKGSYDIRPYIHSTGNAWRLARHGLDLQSVDVTDVGQVRDAVEGCTHVVNATGGPREVMLRGLDNLLRACLDSGVKRYVHLSSVSVYGEHEPGTLLREDAAPAKLTDHGQMKLAQDHKVEAACRNGLPCVIFAPPNVSGAYSPFLVEVLTAVRDGALALVDGGDLPCSLVDVENLALAMESSLFCETADAGRMFVTDDDTPTWRKLVEALSPLAGRELPLPTLTRGEAHAFTEARARRPSVTGALRSIGSILMSETTRRIVEQDPLMGPGYRFVADGLPEVVKRRIKAFAPSGDDLEPESQEVFDTDLLQVQLSAVRHSCEAARSVLGYRPLLSFRQSMDAFLSWYRTLHGFGGGSWAALSQL